MSSVKIQGSATGTAAFTIAVPDGTSTDRTINLPDAAGSFVLADGSGNVDITGTVTADRLTADASGEAILSLNGYTASQNTEVQLVAIRDDVSTSKSLLDIKTNDGTSLVRRIRINSSGNVLINRTSTVGYKLDVYGDVKIERPGTSATHVVFTNANGNVGTITTSGTSTSYNTSSDYRLKENVTELTGAIDRIKQVPVHRFNFVADPNTTVDGFLAHEVQTIVPEAIHGEKDAMKTEEYEVTPAVLDDDGNVVTEAVMGTREVIDPQGIDQSKLVPLLTAALQEAITKIEALETRLAALEAV